MFDSSELDKVSTDEGGAERPSTSTETSRHHGDAAGEGGANLARSTNRRVFLVRSASVGAAALFGGSEMVERAVASLGVARSTGTLRVGVGQDVITFNPDNLAFGNFIYTRNMYDTLLEYGPSLNLIPRIARSWRFASDHLSVTVRLRPGLTFASGTPVDAASVQKNFQWSSDPNVGHQVSGLLAIRLKTVHVVDPATLLITFKAPTPQLAATDLLQSVPIIDPKYLVKGSEAQLKNTGGGSGPFSLTQWTPGHQLTLNGFQNFWNRPNPRLSQVVFSVFQNNETMVAALRSGGLDLALYLPANLANSLGSNFVVSQGHTGALTYDLEVNTTKAPFDNKLARQALQYAIDRQGIVKTVLFGQSRATALPWGPGSPAYDPSANIRYSFDLAKTKQMFEAAGVTAGTSFEIITPSTYPELTSIAEILKADLAKIGYTLNIQTMDVNNLGPALPEERLPALPRVHGQHCEVSNSNYTQHQLSSQRQYKLSQYTSAGLVGQRR